MSSLSEATYRHTLSILIAYPYFKPDVVRKMASIPKSRYRLIVDSGAFTAWNIGKKIELDEYCKFLDSIEHLRPFNAVQLDVFGDPEASYKNFLIMRKRGYDVMPVFTRGESLERLDEYYRETDYIMFGGIVIGGKNKNYVKWWLNRNKGRKAHWLGFVNMPFIKHYKPESVDSSSWCGAARYGRLELYADQGQMKGFHRTYFNKKIDDETMRLAFKHGYSPTEVEYLKHSDAWVASGNPPNWEKGLKSTAQFLHSLAHIKRAFDVEKNLGTKIYMAVPNEPYLNGLIYGYEFLKERKIIE